jgi:SAM-dependent methyltransferase
LPEALRSCLTRDRELEAGSRAHYEDPAYYDQAYRGQTDDVAYYAKLAAGCPCVLEYGIGNGRIALPIARLGTAVVGIDSSKAMLADLRARLRRESREVRARITARRGDMRGARLGRNFPLVLCTFNTALHLYTRRDVERWLARVHEHLAPGGELVVDIGMPILEDLTRAPSKPFRVPPFVHPTAGCVKYHEYFDYDRIRQIVFVSMCFEPVSPTTKSKDDGAFMTPLTHRQFFPQEWEALLHYNGFKVEKVFGDFHGGPLTATSNVMVWHARARRNWRKH